MITRKLQLFHTLTRSASDRGRDEISRLSKSQTNLITGDASMNAVDDISTKETKLQYNHELKHYKENQISKIIECNSASHHTNIE